MSKSELIELLKKHLKQVEVQAGMLYIMRMKQMIAKLESGGYQFENDLIFDLQSLGFSDLAKTVKRSMFI